MADQYGFTPEDYIDDMNILSHERYSQGMLFLILLFFKRRLKPFQVIVATLMVYDLSITFLNRSDFPFVNNHSTSLLF